jgi:phage-related minor tail protein
MCESLGSHGDRTAGSLPVALHDTAAVRIGSGVYLFGGGTNTGTQATRSFASPPPAAVRSRSAGCRRRAPTNQRRPSAVRRTSSSATPQPLVEHDRCLEARLERASSPTSPSALRYAAVTAAGGTVVIAGGSLANGTASSVVLAYTPGRGLQRIGSLPAPTTHAAAASIDDVAFVIGGRGLEPNRRPGA